MYTNMDEMTLVSNLLYALGLSINSGNNSLIDQETGSNMQFEGKNIKATRDPSKPVYISETDIKLEPVNPKSGKLMKSLFGFFLNKEEELGEIPHPLSYYFDDKTEDDELRHRLVIKYSNGTYYYGNWYKNKCVGYCEAILSIDGSFPLMDFNIFDIDEVE